MEYKDRLTLELLEESLPSPEERNPKAGLCLFKSGDSLATNITMCLQSVYERANDEVQHHWFEFRSLVFDVIELASSSVKDIDIKLLPLQASSNVPDDGIQSETDFASQRHGHYPWREGDQDVPLEFELPIETDLLLPIIPPVSLPHERASEAEAESTADADHEVESQINALPETFDDTSSSSNTIDPTQEEGKRSTGNDLDRAYHSS